MRHHNNDYDHYNDYDRTGNDHDDHLAGLSLFMHHLYRVHGVRWLVQERVCLHLWLLLPDCNRHDHDRTDNDDHDHFSPDNDDHDHTDNDHDCTNDYDYNLLLLRPVDRRELRHRRLCEHSDISEQRVYAVWLQLAEQVRELCLVHNDYHIDADHDNDHDDNRPNHHDYDRADNDHDDHLAGLSLFMHHLYRVHGVRWLVQERVCLHLWLLLPDCNHRHYDTVLFRIEVRGHGQRV
jgi:hypothetical protein